MDTVLRENVIPIRNQYSDLTWLQLEGYSILKDDENVYVVHDIIETINRCPLVPFDPPQAADLIAFAVKTGSTAELTAFLEKAARAMTCSKTA